MCGILGGNNFESKKIVGEILKTMNYRGSDFSSVVSLKNKMYFGHTRLSIQDISNKSNQPFKSNCGRYYLVYNGELWNSTFQEWDKYLRERYDFVTKKSDTELLLYFLIHHKDDLVTQLPKLNGMFSFGFYDNIEDTFNTW